MTLASLETTAPFKLASYRHYKGDTYTLLFIARNSEDREEELAVYVSHKRRQVWVRPWKMFNELVLWPNGKMLPRFMPIEAQCECGDCTEPAACIGLYDDHLGEQATPKFACNKCCLHGREDGWCVLLERDHGGEDVHP